MKNFEMAMADDPEAIIKATQSAVLTSMRLVLKSMREDVGGPGLTWDQIEMIIDMFKKKEPTIIKQEHEA